MDLQGFHFANPVWLYWLPVLPICLVLFFFASRAKHTTFFIGNPRLVEKTPGVIAGQWFPWLLRFLVIFLCIVAAARPQAGQKKVEEKKEVTDLWVTFDVSGSMITQDLKPNRVTAAKKLLAEFLDKIQNARVGMTVFARISFTQCPLTQDVQIMKKLLESVDVSSVKLDGTAIGDALVSSLNRLKEGEKGALKAGANKSPVLSKWLGGKTDEKPEVPNHEAIILMTDGENNCGMVDPFQAAKIAASQGVKIYAIGMGSSKRTPMMGRYPDGHIGPFIDQRTGEIVMQDPVDMITLREIARITGGKAYAATDNRALQEVLDEIAKLEKREVSVTTHWEYNELASNFLLVAFFLLALDLGLGTTVLRTLP